VCVRKLHTRFCVVVKIMHQYVEPYRHDSRLWVRDRHTFSYQVPYLTTLALTMKMHIDTVTNTWNVTDNGTVCDYHECGSVLGVVSLPSQLQAPFVLQHRSICYHNLAECSAELLHVLDAISRQRSRHTVSWTFHNHDKAVVSKVVAATACCRRQR